MDDTTLIDALKISGPAGGAVVVLGALIKAWFGQLRTELVTLHAAVAEIKGELIADLRERVAKLEAKVGQRRRSDESS
ncbi:MAG: hypothetical protein K0U78_16315 [Actinomycetia bacterium]|nr:hypothetical protein [Actinomycetes bacterium]